MLAKYVRRWGRNDFRGAEETVQILVEGKVGLSESIDTAVSSG
jgi:hypothetical protein